MTDTTATSTTTAPKKSEWSKIGGFFKHIFDWFDGNGANFATSAATTISLATPLLNTLTVLTAGEPAGVKVAAVVTKTVTAFNNVAAMLRGAEATTADHTVSGILNTVLTDLPTLLQDADVKNSAHLAEIEGTVTTVVGEVEAIIAAIPADHSVPVVGAAKTAAA